jgi:hypothetical protein
LWRLLLVLWAWLGGALAALGKGSCFKDVGVHLLCREHALASKPASSARLAGIWQDVLRI